MPHLKVKPFETDKIDAICGVNSILKYRAIEDGGNRELIGVDSGKNNFLLEVIKRDKDFLVKCDATTRPLDIEEIKKALSYLANQLDLDILHSNINPAPKKPSIASKYEKSIEDFENPNFGFDKIAVEVGFGSGRHLLYQAKQNPNRLHIGIEIHTPSAQQVLKQIHLQGLDNIWIVNYDARLLMEMLPSNSCQAIFVHFPVPWDKKPHRRVISIPFVDESLRVLEVDGFLELRTDSQNYYEYALKVFSSFNKISFKVEKNRDIGVVSKYEARWKKQEKNIYTLTVINDREDKEIKKDFDFDFKDSIECNKILNLPSKSIVEDNYFIHFGKKYIRNDGKGCLIDVAFGSFDRPESKFIAIEDNEMKYIPFKPVANKTAYKAHKKIEEILNV